MPKISFILPIYNVNQYLDKCVDSLYSQGLNEGEYEIVMVNDGSTDSSLETCNRYAGQDHNIVVVDQENKGISGARNSGLDVATGDYVAFVDPDDYLNPGALRYVLDHFNIDKYQIIRYWSKIINENEASLYDDCCGFSNYDGDTYGFMERFGIDNFCHGFLFNREWINNLGLRFSTHSLGEDYVFITKAFLSNPSIISTTCRVYRYVKHPNSVTGIHSATHSAKCARAFIGVFEELFSYTDKLGVSSEDKQMQYVLSSMQGKMISFMSRLLSSDIKIPEIRQLVAYLKDKKIAPIEGVREDRKSEFLRKSVNFLLSHPSMVVVLRPLYSHIFCPLILPRINKN